MRRLRAYICVVLVAALLAVVSCSRSGNQNASPERLSGSSSSTAERESRDAHSRHDLQRDEELGGHTLRRHVGRTDQQLRERLDHEPNIGAASTYTDRATAEAAIGSALSRNREKIERWLARNRHPNLVLDYDSDSAVGRTLHRRDVAATPCSHVLVVLKWNGPLRYYVLTSYPECR